MIPEDYINKTTYLSSNQVINGELNIRLSHWRHDSCGDTSVLIFSCGPSATQINISSTQCRELAAKLLQHAYEFDARCEATAKQAEENGVAA